MELWEPSQYGLLADAPQRQNAVSVVSAMVTLAAFCTVSGPLASSGPPGIMEKATGPVAVISVMVSAGAASPASIKPAVRWEPSQKGFFAEWPQRQSDARGWFTTSAPVSICSSPVAMSGPFGAVNATFAGSVSLKYIPPTPV